VSSAVHIDEERALFLVALDDDDAEKRAAFEHAATCAACTTLLRESTAMMRMIDEELPRLSTAVDPALASRVRAAVLAPAAPRFHFERLAWVLGAIVSGLLILLDGHADEPLAPLLGLHCLRFELLFGAGAFAAGVAVTRLRAARGFGPLEGSVLAMTGALVGQILLRTRCEAHDAALHLLVFHGLGVVLATALGGVAGRLIQRRA
jgi:hypothetical protein